MERGATWVRAVAFTLTLACAASAETRPASAGADAATAAKEDDEQAVAIRLEGDWQGCPTPTDFFARLAQRAPGIRLTRPGEPGWVFVARMARAERGSVHGVLRVHDLDGGVLERDVSGASCIEVAEALALIGAVTIRPGIAVDYDAVRRAFVQPSPAAQEFAAPPSAAALNPWSFSLRGVGSVRSNVLPVPLYAVGLGAELAREGTGIWRPAIGLAAAATLRATADTDSALTRTELTGQLFFGQVSVSPLALRMGPLELRPYGTLELGVLTATGQGTGLSVPRQSRELWVAAALLAQGDVFLGENWRCGAYAGAALHPIRYLFHMTPVDVYQTRLVGFAAGASISFRMN